ncbi:hypothetical protein OVN18_01135 [Microcella daejeonensis]|uniref:Uncharacterized protein n=1 Tax=Microcella daejeonensis TaxID=2994971 RepID=A0A9E8ML75_9MICO|nr:hypothetical protein [Microcella daejeonensis]WAB81654.1 hypothetical protein OVN18_01135 [Microcella daejeonensis]
MLIISLVFAVVLTPLAVVFLLGEDPVPGIILGVVALLAGGIATRRIAVMTRARRAALREWRAENQEGLSDLRAMGGRGVLALASSARAISRLEKGDAPGATRILTSAVERLRGRRGAETFFAVLLPYRAAALAASGDAEGARASLEEGERAFAALPSTRKTEAGHVPVQLERVRRELGSERFDLQRVMADLAAAEATA